MDTDGSIYSGNKLLDRTLFENGLKKTEYLKNIICTNVKKWRFALDNSFKFKIAEKFFEEQVLFTYLKVIQEVNDRNASQAKFPSGVEFCLLQSRKNKRQREKLLFDLVKFYNDNFTGNKDFIHIPSLNEIRENSKFPILLAIAKDKYGKETILGTTTIKFERNLSDSDDPYFPIKDKYVLSINGILTKLDLNDENGNRIKGMGKELFEIAMRGAYALSRYKPLSLMCKIDCRNLKSMKSITHASEELRKCGIYSEVYIEGYYELRDSEEKLMEAPTFTMGVHFNEKRRMFNRIVNISYEKCEKKSLYEDIKSVINSNMRDIVVYKNKEENKNIIYHKIKPVSLDMCRINVGNSATGNERMPAKMNLFA